MWSSGAPAGDSTIRSRHRAAAGHRHGPAAMLIPVLVTTCAESRALMMTRWTELEPTCLEPGLQLIAGANRETLVWFAMCYRSVGAQPAAACWSVKARVGEVLDELARWRLVCYRAPPG